MNKQNHIRKNTRRFTWFGAYLHNIKGGEENQLYKIWITSSLPLNALSHSLFCVPLLLPQITSSTLLIEP